MPNQYASFEKGMKQAGGWPKFAPLFQAQLNAALEQSAYSDPKHMQETAQKAASVQPRSPTDFESYVNNPKLYAAFMQTKDKTKQIAMLELADALASLEKKPRNESHIARAAMLMNFQPTVEESTTKELVRGKDGTYSLQEKKTKGPGNQPQKQDGKGATAKPEPKKEPIKLPPGATLK
jgi:hypothetical protein